MLSEGVGELLGDLRLVDEDRYTLMWLLRRLIFSVDQGISEEVKYGGLLYSSSEPFCGIFSYTEHVSMEFSKGAVLSDKYHVLEGSGKFRRHIKIRVADEISSKHLREYITQAFMMASKQ